MKFPSAAILLCLTIGFFSASAFADDNVIVDMNLRKAINQGLNLQNGTTRVDDAPVTAADCAGLNILDWGYKPENDQIESLDGLEKCVLRDAMGNITAHGMYMVYLMNNKFTDLTPLAGLPWLSYLWLEGDNIQDLSPLANVSTLASITIANTNVSDIRPLTILNTGKDHIASIIFNNNQISDISPIQKWLDSEAFRSMPPIATIELKNNPIDYNLATNKITMAQLRQRQMDGTLSFPNSGLNCGNGTLDGSEQCDTYGNNTNGDGCDINCTVTACGNGIITTGEKCDDGDVITGDGCSNLCYLEDTKLGDPILGVPLTLKIRQKINTALGRTDLNADITIADCQQISSLHLSNLELGDDDIKVLAHCANIEDLYIDSNNISNIAPIALISKLIRLSARGNNISDISPLGKLDRLQVLDLLGNPIAAILPQLPTSLITLNLTSANNGHGIIADISSLASLTSLEILHLDSNQVADITPLANLPLKELHLFDNNIESLPTDLNAWSGMTKLVISNNHIKSVDRLAPLTKLVSLYIASNPLEVDSVNSNSNLLSSLSGMSELTDLHIAYTNVTNLDPLSNLLKLKQLYALHNPNLTNISGLASSPSLQKIDLTNTGINDISALYTASQAGAFHQQGSYITLYNTPNLNFSSETVRNYVGKLQAIPTTVNFTFAGCGDGAKVAGEECDDRNFISGDGCDENCKTTACGNGIITALEACDDGNTSNNDGCSSVCTVESCGDGIKQDDPNRPELCDDGNNLNGDACRADCSAVNICGDGDRNLATEECDEGNGTSIDITAGDGIINSDTVADACRTDCTKSKCGDGVKDSNEGCDEGANNGDGKACLLTCVSATCGDGKLQAEVEACDEGAMNSDTFANACRTNCATMHCGDNVVDNGEECDSGEENSNSIADACRTNCAKPRCGDGVKDSGEACDDGNSIETDGCLSTCAQATCGDGFVNVGTEVCDDGNSANGDGCDNSCKIEPAPTPTPAEVEETSAPTSSKASGGCSLVVR